MRKVVSLKKNINGVKRLMIYSTKKYTYLFGFDQDADSGAIWDACCDSEEEALSICEEDYGVKPSEWKEIANPEPYCQHDWINPVRIKGRESGHPEFGKFEKFINGKWIEF